MAIAKELQTWIAENIIAGCTPEQLKPALLSAGVSNDEADFELRQAAEHPYIAAAQNTGRRYLDRARKRESLLKTLDELARHQPEYLKVEKVPLPPFKDFLRDYYYKNRLGFFSGAADHWPARQWTPRKLVPIVGTDSIVQIQYDRDKDKNYEPNSNFYRKDIKFGEFIDMVENAGETNNFYLTAGNKAFSNSNLRNLLKDTSNIGDGYLDPAQEKDRIFLWVGPKGIITPLHHDLTNNFFIQFYGTKRWRLIPSMQVPYMYNNWHVYSEVDLLNHSHDTHPDYSKVNIIEIDVEPGDALFVPIGWWHHVVGLDTNISMSFTNFNAPNEFISYPADTRY